MATLPVIGERPTPTPNISIASDRSGEIIAGAVRQLGNVAVHDVGQFVRAENDVETARKKALSVLSLAKTTNALYDAHDDVARRVLDGSLPTDKAAEEFNTMGQKLKEEMLGTLTDPAQKASVEGHLIGITGTLGRTLNGVVTKRQQQETAGFIDQYIEEQSRTIGRDGPARAAERVGDMISFTGQSAGLNPAQQSKLRQSVTERMHATSFAQEAETAFEAGDQAALSGIRERIIGNEGAALDPAKRTEMRHQIFSWERQIAGQNVRQKDAADRIAADTIKTLEKFADEGRSPDPTYQQEIRLQTRGTAWEKQAEELITSAQAGAALGSMPIPRQAEIVAKLESSAGNPSEVVQAKRARRILDTQRAAYKDDMWDAAARFQRGMPIVQAQQISDASQLLTIAHDRIPMMSQLESATGMPAELLRPAEVPQAVASLAGMAIPKRAEILGQLGSMLDIKRQSALADQLAKGDDSLAISMKLGADKTTAGRMVSELVQVGKQALGDKTVKKDETALSGWRSDIAGYVRGAIGDPKAEDDVINAAYYVRAAQELDSAKARGFTRGFGSGAEDALAMVIGQPLDRGGVKTFMPKGMDENAFDAKIREVLSAGAGQTIYSRGQPVKVEELAYRLRGYGMRMVRPGEYMPIVNNAPFTVDKEGQQPLRIRVQ